MKSSASSAPRGLTPRRDNGPGGFESVHVPDPDGFDLQLCNGQGHAAARQAGRTPTTGAATSGAAAKPSGTATPTGWQTMWLDHVSFSVSDYKVSASFYAPVQVVGVVGKDFPQSHIEWLAKRRIDTTVIEVVDGETFHWVGSYNQNLNEAKTLSTRLNVFEHFNPKLSNNHRDADYVFLANIDPVLQQSVLDQVTRIKKLSNSVGVIAGKDDEFELGCTRPAQRVGVQPRCPCLVR